MTSIGSRTVDRGRPHEARIISVYLAVESVRAPQVCEIPTSLYHAGKGLGTM